MKARMKNPIYLLPNLLEALQQANACVEKGGLPDRIAKLVHLRASQINGCSVCVDMHAHELKQLGESDERLFAVAAWRETTFFDERERAALALAEAGTRLADRGDAVSDAIWDEAARHFDERALAALVTQIAFINFWNRLNALTRQVAGAQPRWHG